MILTIIGKHYIQPFFGIIQVKGVENTMIVYDRLWQTLKDKGISQYALIKRYHVSPGQLTRLKRNESVSTHTIDMFCKILDCEVNDVMEYKREG